MSTMPELLAAPQYRNVRVDADLLTLSASVTDDDGVTIESTLVWRRAPDEREVEVLQDIRELTDDREAYAAELRRRWGGLLSYRYLGRTYESMDLGPVDNTVTLRRDMRNATGGLLLAVLGISSPEGGHMSDLEAVPNPVIHSCQIVDPGRDVAAHRGRVRDAQTRPPDGLQPVRIVDADNPSGCSR